MKRIPGIFLLAVTFAFAAGLRAELSFLVVGDWGRDGQFNQTDVAREMGVAAARAQARFTISVGDNFYEDGVKDVNDPQWRTSFEEIYTASALQHPWYVALGNHDYQGSVQAQIDYSQKSARWRMPARWFSFREEVRSGVWAEFFVLDTQAFVPRYREQVKKYPDILGTDAAAQLLWLDQSLAASTAAWKIVVGHHPIFSASEKHGDTEALVRDVMPLLRRHGVQVYLNGHEHDLQHLTVDGIHFFCSGAGSRTRETASDERTRFALGNRSGFLVAKMGADAGTFTFLDYTGREVHRAEISRNVPPTATATAVATFHSVGLYWKPASGAADNECGVWYRAAGESEWQRGMALWFDPNRFPGQEARAQEYRGSLVNLRPGTVYEIRLQLARTGDETSVRVKTWSEEFPIAERRALPPGVTGEPLVITSGGSAERGYVLYESSPTAPSVIDVAGKHPVCVRIEAPFVILRGATLRGATQHGIVLGATHNVVIERGDISGWGSAKSDVRWGVNLHSAIYSEHPDLARVIVQRNRLHHPRSDANSWAENGHPEGPQGVTFKGSAGNHVIRYNEIFSDEEHGFNDGMGETSNMSFGGFPNRDSDIYGNFVRNAWDDGIESEGANMNVRVFGNYVESAFNAIGAACTSLGPHYVFRNVSGYSRKDPPGVEARTPFPAGGYIIKLGTRLPRAETFARGRAYFFHNTLLQPEQDGRRVGMRRGAYVTNRDYRVWNLVTRNNIFDTRAPDDEAIHDPSRDTSNDFDHDLVGGAVVGAPGAQRSGVVGRPQYATEARFGYWALASGSPGYDAALRLPNFNDGFTGAAPDMGATEAGRPALRFGVQADWNEQLVPVPLSR